MTTIHYPNIEVVVHQTTSYRIRIEPGVVDRLGEALAPLLHDLRSHAVHVVTDVPVAERYQQRVLAGLGSCSIDTHTTVLPAGELSKSADQLLQILHALCSSGTQRRDLLIALGGGTICDLAGMAAATFMRGVPYVNVPTTLLAQVDAAIGGKVGIDFAGVKNLLGTFHQPAAVLIDPGVLTTLPNEHLVNGFAEIVKVALLADPMIYRLIDRYGRQLLDPEHPRLPWLVHRSAQLKVQLLRDDPFETGSLARPLNLGHCFGHPLEAASDFQMPHGQAVARGIAAAATLGHQRGRCSAAAMGTILRTLRSVGLPTDVPRELRQRSWRQIEAIRRVRNGALHPVIPIAPGRVEIGGDVTSADWYAVADALDSDRCGDGLETV